MFEGWGEFYLLVGSAAAVLIGLLFVVLTQMHLLLTCIRNEWDLIVWLAPVPDDEPGEA